MILTLPKAIKSLNKTMLGKTWKTRHFRQKQENEEWRRLLRSELLKARGRAVPHAYASSLHITRVYGKGERAYDRDNLAGGCKGLVDVMKGWLIEDDAPGKCNITYGQVKGPTAGVRGGNTIVVVRYGEEREFATSGMETRGG